MRDKSRLLLEVSKAQSARVRTVCPRLLRPYALWFPISILAAACATTKKAEEPPKPTHYVLEDAPSIIATLPFPNQYPIYVKIYAADILLERRLAYRGWDVDHDGLIDMIHYLDEEGEVIKTVYKFAGDKEPIRPSH